MSNSPRLRDFTHLRGEFVELTARLMAFRSSRSRPDQIADCAAFISGWLDEAGIGHSVLEHQGVPSILVGRGGYAPVLLLTHLDVVEGRDEQFNARLDGDWLVGRGSIDDKYAVALCLLLYRELTFGGADPKFRLLITGDEESGGRNGAGVLSREIRPDFCLALDGGSPKEIITRQKGVLRLSLTENGLSAHGARPWHGDNAAVKLLQDCLGIVRYFGEIAARAEASKPARCPESGLPPVPDYWYPTCNLGILRAGETVNQVPDFASAQFDIRYTEMDDPKALFAAVQSVTGGEIELVTNIPPLKSLDSEFIEDLLFCVPGADFSVGYGASDAQYFSSHGVPCVIWGAQGNNSQHSDDERMNIPSALDVLRRLECFLRDL